MEPINQCQNEQLTIKLKNKWVINDQFNEVWGEAPKILTV